jgi:hypothetical protein
MLEILTLIPKENLTEINIDSLIKNKAYYPIDNSGDEAVKYLLTDVNDSLGTLRIEMSFETGQRGFAIQEFKRIKEKNNECLVVYSLVTGAPITFGQSELKMYRLRKRHLTVINENLLPTSIGLTDFLKPGTPDSIIRQYNEYSNHSYGLIHHGENVYYVLYENFDSYGIDKSWLLGNKIEFVFERKRFKRLPPRFSEE